MTDDPAPSTPTDKKPPLKERLKSLMAEYGNIAITIYLSIFALTLSGFFIAIKAGFEVDSGSEKTGTVVIAYAATKALQPIRILLTLALTPVIARFLRRKKTAA